MTSLSNTEQGAAVGQVRLTGQARLAELARLKRGLAARNTDVLQVTPAISERAAELVDSLALSHGMRLADALIGATAIVHGATLITANTRHFEAVQNLVIEAFIP